MSCAEQLERIEAKLVRLAAIEARLKLLTDIEPVYCSVRTAAQDFADPEQLARAIDAGYIVRLELEKPVHVLTKDGMDALT